MSPPDDVMPTEKRSELQLFRDFAALYREQVALKASLKEIEDEMDAMKPGILDALTSINETKLSVEGITVFVRRDLYVRSKDGGPEGTAAVCGALHAVGMAHYCHETFNAKGLSAHVRELEKKNAERLEKGEVQNLGELLPPELAQVLNCEPTFSVMATPSRRE